MKRIGAGRASLEPSERTSWHPRLSAAFACLERAGIRWALLRDPLNPGNPSGDIDILVHAEDRERLNDELQEGGFTRIPRSGTDLHLVRYDRTTDAWLWLHVVDRIRAGPCGLLQPGCEEELLRRRRTTGDVSRLAPPDAFWVLLLHCLLDIGRVPEGRRSQLQAMGRDAPERSPLVDVLVAVAPGPVSPGRLLEHVRSGAWSELESAGPRLSEAWFRGASLSGRRLRLCRLRASLDRAFDRRFRRGLTVAVIGPDGAGKSTLVDGLRRTFVFPVKPIYMGLTGGVLPAVDRLRVPGLVQAGHVAVFWIRYLRGLYRKVKGHLVVFERYVFDAVAPHPDPQGAVQRGIRRLYGRSCPAPDVTFLLDAPGTLMHERSGEYSPDVLEDWRRHFLTLRHRVPNVEVVDATRPADEVRADVTERIWKRYRRRWDRAGG